MGPQLEALVKSKSTCRLVKIDIGSWGSPVAAQHGIRQLPTLWLYDGNSRVATGPSVLARVSSLD